MHLPKVQLIATLSLLTVFTLSFITCSSQALAQGIEGTYVYDLADQEAIDGDIIVSTAEGFVRANRAYDLRIFGVVQQKPLVVVRRVDNTGTPVVRSGVAEVNVSSSNGPIKTGEYITSSEIAGKGQRANVSGPTLGVALGDFDGTTGDQVELNGVQVTTGRIPVAIKIEYVELTGSRSLGRAFDYFNNAFFSNVQDPERFTQIIRYIMAGLAILISFAVAFFTFSRSIPKATEAIGRNPLAANTIRFSILLNTAFTVGVGLVGVIAAIIIIKL